MQLCTILHVFDYATEKKQNILTQGLYVNANFTCSNFSGPLVGARQV